MINFILELIDFNEGIDYGTVSKIVTIYLILLWFFVSLWLYNDAKYRFNNLILAVLLGVLNFFLSFPFLLIYLLIRPSHREEWDDYIEEGGINIPIINFTQQDGIVISLQLKVNNKKLSSGEAADYNLNVVLDTPHDEDDTLKATSEVTSLPSIRKARIAGMKLRISGLIESISGKLRKKDTYSSKQTEKYVFPEKPYCQE